MQKFLPYIGLEYSPNQRKNDVMDCWGLIILLYKDLYNIHLPEFSDVSLARSGRQKTGNVITSAKLYRECQKIDIDSDIKEGDLILISNLGYPTHIGMAIDNTHMIHCFDVAGSVIESYRSNKWKNRIVGIYRHPQLA